MNCLRKINCDTKNLVQSSNSDGVAELFGIFQH